MTPFLLSDDDGETEKQTIKKSDFTQDCLSRIQEMDVWEWRSGLSFPFARACEALRSFDVA